LQARNKEVLKEDQSKQQEKGTIHSENFKNFIQATRIGRSELIKDSISIIIVAFD
jgi:hypothetical protein